MAEVPPEGEEDVPEPPAPPPPAPEEEDDAGAEEALPEDAAAPLEQAAPADEPPDEPPDEPEPPPARDSEEAVKTLKWGVFGLVVTIAGVVAGIVLLLRPTTKGFTNGDIDTLVKVGANLTSGLAFLHEGTLLVADGPGIRAVDLDGEDYEFVDVSGEAGGSAFVRDISVAPGGRVYFSDDLGTVRRYHEGTVEVIAYGAATPRSLRPARAAFDDLDTPRGVAATADGFVYVADMLNDRIVRFDPAGTAEILDVYIHMPNDMAVDPAGDPYVADYEGRVYRITPSHRLEERFDVRTTRSRLEESQYSFAFISFAPDGDLVVADELEHRIWRVDGDDVRAVLGDGTDYSSPDGIDADAATIYSPWAVAVTSDYRLIVSESGKLRVVELVP